jgi:lipid-binding SYLF domain-containing protein
MIWAASRALISLSGYVIQKRDPYLTLTVTGLLPAIGQHQTKESNMHKFFASLLALTLLTLTTNSWAFEPDSGDEMQLSVAKAILDVKKADPGMQKFFDESAGVAVFPRVGKGGIGIGGAHGKGLVIVNDKAIGTTSLSQVTVGLQLGGQVYAQFVFFQDDTALGHFQRGNFELGAQASAVAVTLGASADADYDQGVAVFTNVGGGLMYEAVVSGQKFKYAPLAD